jgi:tetratricopeptide (TPR) repeat protein
MTMRNSTISEGIYDQVMELVHDIVDATYAEDSGLIAKTHEALRRYCVKQMMRGENHPFIPETLADFTEDHETAIRLYKQALELAERTQNQTHSILLSLAERYRELGLASEEKTCLEAAYKDAVSMGDEEDIEKAETLLKEHQQMDA